MYFIAFRWGESDKARCENIPGNLIFIEDTSIFGLLSSDFLLLKCYDSLDLNSA
jgi:hypothetical protein